MKQVDFGRYCEYSIKIDRWNDLVVDGCGCSAEVQSVDEARQMMSVIQGWITMKEQEK